MDTRTIYYVDENLDYLDKEVQLALSRTDEDNLKLFCETLISNYALLNIDVINYPVKREIRFIEDE
jgi:hypothetical protein